MSQSDDEKQTLKAIAENIKRIEEMLRFLPLHDSTVNEIRGKIALLRTVLLEQRPPAFALVGRRGAGKSSLVNAIFGSKVAEVGHIKAQTGRGKWFEYTSERGALSILDTRGIQEGSTPKEADEAKDAIKSIVAELKKKTPDVIVFLVKATEADSAIDADLDALERVYAEIERVHAFRPPLVAIATHCDVLEPKITKLHQAATENAEDIAEKLGRVGDVEHHVEEKIKSRPKLEKHLRWVRGISSYLSFRDDGSVRADERWHINELAEALFKNLPDESRGLFVRIARVKGLQEELASNLTRACAAICAGIAALPIPVADVIPITTLQVTLVAAIAWLGGRKLDRKGAAEFLSSMGLNVGLGFAFREGFRALSKVVAPGLGSMISGSIAFGGTLAIGAAARAYYLRNESVEKAREVFSKEKDKQPDEETKSKYDIN